MKVENLPRKRSLDHSLDDPRPMKYRNSPGYNDYVRNVTINYVAATGHDLTIRYIFPVANLRAAVLDHDYCQLPITEYWVQESTKVMLK